MQCFRFPRGGSWGPISGALSTIGPGYAVIPAITSAMQQQLPLPEKKRSDQWIEFERLPLTSVKVDEGYQLEITSSELYTLLINLRKLYQLANAYGVPQGKKSFLEVSGALADLLALADPELQEFFTSKGSTKSRSPWDQLFVEREDRPEPMMLRFTGKTRSVARKLVLRSA
jgi:hypothetical protein